jgi:pimeloyl-ACP methyl ester carboxylesterase
VPEAVISGWRTYYDVDGDGVPVVLLHGGLIGAETWSQQTPALVGAGYKVYAPERRGHGRTPDAPGPLSYVGMAEETIAFIDEVVEKPAHVIGLSDGAVVGALVAMQRPDIVSRLILIGQYFNPDGQVPGSVEWLRTFREPNEWIRESYERLSPDGPDHLVDFLNKSVDMWESEPNIELADLAAITAPTLLLQGDDDIVLLDHSDGAARVIPNCRLAVLPGSHLLPWESPGLVNALLVQFLAGDAPRSAWG